ncbi:MAG: VCBS repeat-containing protein [Planctomycetes bacterium]|nr:VCBS repeat-containing protein [Planctomycetota bacterium]
MKRRLWPFALAALLSACSGEARLGNYEVGELEEERVQKAVKAIAAGLELGDAARCVSAVAPDFRQAFDAGQTMTLSSADGMTVSRWSPGNAAAPEIDRAGLQKWFAEYLATWQVVERGLAKIRSVKFDEENPDSCVGFFFLDVYGISAGGEAREDFVNLELGFRREAELWLITAIKLGKTNYSTHCAKAQFRNVSREANMVWPHEEHPGARGYLPIPEETADCGLGCGDYDGDGWYDVFLCNGKHAHLLRNKHDGTFEDVTEKAGLWGCEGESRAALFADLDNDGDQDLYVAFNEAPCLLYRNNGDGTFTDVTKGSGIEFSGWCTSVVAADYDRDGLVDFYQCCYGNFYEKFPLPPTNDGQPNRLLHNKGGLKFEEVGDDADVDDTGWTLGAAWTDVNNDGWPDLLVANDFGDHRMYVNQKDGTFDEVAEDAGAMDRNFGMSACAGDLDGDGDMDIYYSNMFSNTNWIFNRPELLPVPWFLGWLRTHILGTLDDMTKGNTLLINKGDGTFESITREAGVDYGQWAWGGEMIDYDADGDLDIYCLNGFISGTDSEDL